jgi:cobaltochelatase CobT
VTIVDAEERGGAMTEKLAELFDDKASIKQAKTSTRRKVA